MTEEEEQEAEIVIIEEEEDQEEIPYQEEEEVTEEPLKVVVGADEKDLQEGRCSSMNPCGECVGDCDYDTQCEGDLECFPRRVGDISPVAGKHLV